MGFMDTLGRVVTLTLGEEEDSQRNSAKQDQHCRVRARVVCNPRRDVLASEEEVFVDRTVKTYLVAQMT